MNFIMLAAAAALALLTAAVAFAGNSHEGGQFINPNTRPLGFYDNNLQHNQWGPHVIFRFYRGGFDGDGSGESGISDVVLQSTTGNHRPRRY